ncbi:unnamed protein product [Rhizoctonia solani]|uniref:NAD(P)-binding domain-containing protein n=1 Tax=Rhizoctonia solani TaxID=456999 RepID=A0A8H3B0R1_9AGAM|nr:unnamed protein product [Rhizoctonia solani]
MRVLLLGASRNVGYFVAQRLVAQGHICTLLLRNTDAMESDPAMADFIRDGKIKLVRGDGLVSEDVQRAWDTTRSDGDVDLVYFGIGGYPKFSITQGFVLTPADLTTRSAEVLLSVIQTSTTPTTRPKLVVITSNGLDKRTHALLPLLLKPVYKYALRTAHEDKIGLEKNVQTAAGWDGGADGGWFGSQNLVVVRPAMFTDGECLGNQKADAYRVGEELAGAWTVSRADVAHFVAEKVLADWHKWAGKSWVIAY